MLFYHFSEDPNIEVFHPIDGKVWAIDEEHAVNYYFPRDCPRIIFSKSEHMTEDDLSRFFGHTSANTIIAVESRWFEVIRHATLYKYTFHEEGFELLDETAGYYISSKTIEPINVEPMQNLLDHIVQKGVELRITPNLYPLRDAIMASSIDDFSIIRFRNARNNILKPTDKEEFE